MEKLGVNIPLLLSQLVNFGILAFLLYKVCYKPILRMLKERRERIERAMVDADSTHEAAAKAQQEYDRRIAEAKKEAQQILSQAAQKAEQVRAEIATLTQQETEAILAKAREKAISERTQILAESQGLIVDLSLKGAERVLNSELTYPDRQRQLVMQYLKELHADQLN